MFKVHHIFPSTREWGETTVNTLCEALKWYECKSKARNSMECVLTMYDQTSKILKQQKK